MGQGETRENSMDNDRPDADDERGVYTIYLGGMTLEEYLRAGTSEDEAFCFVSPRWLADLARGDREDGEVGGGSGGHGRR
jgi:hypothetical protein